MLCFIILFINTLFTTIIKATKATAKATVNAIKKVATSAVVELFTFDNGTTGDCIWTLVGTTLTISAEGAICTMEDYFRKNSPWSLHSKNIKKVIIKKGVLRIGVGSFYDSTNLTKVIIPQGIIYIGNDAFGGCKSLTSVTIPDSVIGIGNRAFNNCSSLTEVTIPNSVTFIDDYAFSFCTSLTSIVIPKNVTIGEFVFSDCYALKNIFTNIYNPEDEQLLFEEV